MIYEEVLNKIFFLLVRPSSVTIKALSEPLVEGREAKIECVSEGSVPPAKIRWEKTINEKSIIMKSTVSTTRRAAGHTDITNNFKEVEII